VESQSKGRQTDDHISSDQFDETQMDTALHNQLLSAEDLLTASSNDYSLIIPPSILNPSREQSQDSAATSQSKRSIPGQSVIIRTLTLQAIQQVLEVGQQNPSQIPLLTIQKALVKPSLTPTQVSQLSAGLVDFLMVQIQRISGLPVPVSYPLEAIENNEATESLTVTEDKMVIGHQSYEIGDQITMPKSSRELDMDELNRLAQTFADHAPDHGSIDQTSAHDTVVMSPSHTGQYNPTLSGIGQFTERVYGIFKPWQSTFQPETASDTEPTIDVSPTQLITGDDQSLGATTTVSGDSALRRFAQRLNGNTVGVDPDADTSKHDVEQVNHQSPDRSSALDEGEITASSLEDINEILYSSEQPLGATTTVSEDSALRRFAQRLNGNTVGVDPDTDDTSNHDVEQVNHQSSDRSSALHEGEITAGSLEDINEILYSSEQPLDATTTVSGDSALRSFAKDFNHTAVDHLADTHRPVDTLRSVPMDPLPETMANHSSTTSIRSQSPFKDDWHLASSPTVIDQQDLADALADLLTVDYQRHYGDI
jgi:hypothetical protein